MTKSSKVLRKIISDFYMVLILIFLYAPILTMMVLSFNKSKSRTQWGGFTLQWYTQMFDSRSIMSALTTTLIIAFVSALVATVIGTAAAISISSMRTVPRTIVMGVTNIPMLNADIVTGISLMLAFIAFGISLGFKTVLISHITFNIPYVILSVMPKLSRRINTPTRPPWTWAHPLCTHFSRWCSRISCPACSPASCWRLPCP